MKKIYNDKRQKSVADNKTTCETYIQRVCSVLLCRTRTKDRQERGKSMKGVDQYVYLLHLENKWTSLSTCTKEKEDIQRRYICPR